MRHLLKLGLAPAAFMAGCSLLFTSAPSPSRPTEDCTTSVEMPVFDTVVASALTALAVGLFVAGSSCDHPDPRRSIGPDPCGFLDLGGAVSSLVAFPWVFSAAVGYSRTAKCRAAQGR